MKTTTLTTLAMLLSLGLATGLALSDDEHEDDEHRSWGVSLKRKGDVAPVNHATYTSECGSCHMAYPPGLLPARSWQKMMSQLDDHFGDNAELAPQVVTELTEYLVNNSADHSNYRRSRRIVRSLGQEETPLRITLVPYIRHEHDEIPQRMIKGNDKVGSLANCNACHGSAIQGSFREREIRIPGYGRWDD